MEERRHAFEHLYNKCSEYYNIPEIKRIPTDIQDRGTYDKKCLLMCYSKEHPELRNNCGPDWVSSAWYSANIPCFQEAVKKIKAKADNSPTIHKIGWYGNINSANYEVIEHITRPRMKEIGDENSDIFDIVHVDGFCRIDENTPNYLPLEDLTRYSALIDIGGYGYSGRLKFLLFMKRPLIIVDRNYIEYYYDDLIPYVHYIPVKMDLSDLLEKAKWLFENYEECKKMAENAYEFACNHFSEEAIFRRIHHVYEVINA